MNDQENQGKQEATYDWSGMLDHARSHDHSRLRDRSSNYLGVRHLCISSRRADRRQVSTCGWMQGREVI